MSRGHWRAIFAALGVAAFLALLGAGYYQLEQTEQRPYPERKYQPSRVSGNPVRVEDGKPATGAYDPNCESPNNRDDADLCAQWAAVQEVEESNRLTRLSMRINGLEIAAIVVTLIFTAWAAMAAASASRIAQRSLRLYQEAERALLVAGVEFQNGGNAIVVTFKNLGRTTAHVAHFDFCVAPDGLAEVPISLSNHEHRHGITIAPESAYRSDSMSVARLGPCFTIVGGVIYKDNLMGWQVSSIAVAIDRVEQRFRQAQGSFKFTAWIEQAEKLNRESEKRFR